MTTRSDKFMEFRLFFKSGTKNCLKDVKKCLIRVTKLKCGPFLIKKRVKNSLIKVEKSIFALIKNGHRETIFDIL